MEVYLAAISHLFLQFHHRYLRDTNFNNPKDNFHFVKGHYFTLLPQYPISLGLNFSHWIRLVFLPKDYLLQAINSLLKPIPHFTIPIFS